MARHLRIGADAVAAAARNRPPGAKALKCAKARARDEAGELPLLGEEGAAQAEQIVSQLEAVDSGSSGAERVLSGHQMEVLWEISWRVSVIVTAAEAADEAAGDLGPLLRHGVHVFDHGPEGGLDNPFAPNSPWHHPIRYP